MLKVGVIGATGYTGQEIVDVLLRNSGVEISCLTSRIAEGALFSDFNPKFREKISLKCEKLDIQKVSEKCDLVFLALPHTVSMEVVPGFLSKGRKVIDLSADYRLPSGVYEKWYGTDHSDKANIVKAVYGLPELNRDSIKSADLISNPGCYPTSVILGLLPIIKIVKDAGLSIIVDAKSGTSGAGRKAFLPLSFSEVDGNFKCYKPNEHQHIPEMENELSGIAGSEVGITFVPHLMPVKRGILSTIYIKHEGLPEEGELHKTYTDRYKDEPFTRVRPLGEMPQVQDVSGTNYCDIGIKVARGMLIIVSVIDNLLKGAGGQAVQNMNIMLGMNEREGLL